MAPALSVAVDPPARRTLNIGSEKQLLIDDLLFDQSENIRLRLHPAQKSGEHNVVRDRPWESATLNWFSFLEDDGVYRMWYECYDVEGWPTINDTSFCYCESKDGGMFADRRSQECEASVLESGWRRVGFRRRTYPIANRMDQCKRVFPGVQAGIPLSGEVVSRSLAG